MLDQGRDDKLPVIRILDRRANVRRASQGAELTRPQQEVSRRRDPFALNGCRGPVGVVRASVGAGSVADLPLFSGTAPRVTVRPFVQRDTPPKQGKLL